MSSLTAADNQTSKTTTVGIAAESAGRLRKSDSDRQLEAMWQTIKSSLKHPTWTTYWTERWESSVKLASSRVESIRKQYYWLRGTAAASAVTVPALVGLNLAGTGGVAIRWITFGLSLLAALCGAFLSLFRVGDRWFLYRDLHDRLLKIGWAFITAGDPKSESAWTSFREATEQQLTRYSASYEAEVILPSQGDSATKKNGLI